MVTPFSPLRQSSKPTNDSRPKLNLVQSLKDAPFLNITQKSLVPTGTTDNEDIGGKQKYSETTSSSGSRQTMYPNRTPNVINVRDQAAMGNIPPDEVQTEYLGYATEYPASEQSEPAITFRDRLERKKTMRMQEASGGIVGQGHIGNMKVRASPVVSSIGVTSSSTQAESFRKRLEDHRQNVSGATEGKDSGVNNKNEK